VIRDQNKATREALELKHGVIINARNEEMRKKAAEDRLDDIKEVDGDQEESKESEVPGPESPSS